MKKLITFILVLTVAFTTTQAADIPVTENIKRSFSKEFSNANQVSWTWLASTGVFKAAFIFDGKELNAYFNKEGEFIGTSRYISKQQMPVIVGQQLEKEYKDYVVRTIIEHSTTDQTNYFITIEGKNKAAMIKATPSGALSRFKKLKKA